ncbi:MULTISPECIES: hypothetical protein [Hyphomonas]|uniref:hypothetical protein n=1 Tax=Hyphomonas TaxID=85 RepID=UPI003516406F
MADQLHQTLGKVERWHLTLENRTILKNCFLPGDRAEEIDDFADKHNHRRYHESLNNPTSADVYFSRSHEIVWLA